MIDYCPGQVPGIILSDLQYVQITKEGEGGYDIGVTREWLPPSTKTSPLPFVIGAFGEMFDPLANEPLSKRGWYLQERLLSRRTLHYATSQMFWECAHGIQSEDGCFFPRIQPDGTASVEDVGKLTPNALRTLMPFVFKSVEAPLLLFGLDGLWWTDLVAEYSQRNLTVEQDKLSDLAGLARNYAARTGDTYIAGLWHGSLGLDLCWRVYTREELVETSCGEHTQGLKYGKTLSTLRVPATYRAPSWSWASIDAGVTFNHFNWADKLFCTIHGEVKREGIDLFGRVKEGYLQLQGPLLGILCKSPDEQSIWQPFHGVPLVAFYPHYYYEKADEYDVLDTMPFASCRPGFTRHMETSLRGNRVPRSTLQMCRSVGDTTPDHDEGCQSDETIEAITSYMRQIDISVQSGSSSAEARFFDAKAAHSKLVVTGEGHFDVDPTFPCVALFLDNRHCLLLEQTNNEYRDYRRVGLGFFQPESEKIQPVSRDSPTRVVVLDVPFAEGIRRYNSDKEEEEEEEEEKEDKERYLRMRLTDTAARANLRNQGKILKTRGNDSNAWMKSAIEDLRRPKDLFCSFCPMDHFSAIARLFSCLDMDRRLSTAFLSSRHFHLPLKDFLMAYLMFLDLSSKAGEKVEPILDNLLVLAPRSAEVA